MVFQGSARIVRRTARRTAQFIVAVGLIAAVIPGSAAAAGSGATIVRGIQHEYGSCGINHDGYAMTGSLEGCWWVDTFDLKRTAAQGTMLATGTEHFDGCLGQVCGTFWTTYTYTARFDGATELHGRCHHPIQSGVGGFAGARGELSFTDVVGAEPFFYPYWGNVQLERTATTASSTSTARSAAPSTGVAVAPC